MTAAVAGVVATRLRWQRQQCAPSMIQRGASNNSEEEEKSDEFYERFALELANELISLLPIAGPARDAFLAAQEGNLVKYLFNCAVLCADDGVSGFCRPCYCAFTLSWHRGRASSELAWSIYSCPRSPASDSPRRRGFQRRQQAQQLAGYELARRGHAGQNSAAPRAFYGMIPTMTMLSSRLSFAAVISSSSWLMTINALKHKTEVEATACPYCWPCDPQVSLVKLAAAAKRLEKPHKVSNHV